MREKAIKKYNDNRSVICCRIFLMKLRMSPKILFYDLIIYFLCLLILSLFYVFVQLAKCLAMTYRSIAVNLLFSAKCVYINFIILFSLFVLLHTRDILAQLRKKPPNYWSLFHLSLCWFSYYELYFLSYANFRLALKLSEKRGLQQGQISGLLKPSKTCLNENY